MKRLFIWGIFLNLALFIYTPTTYGADITASYAVYSSGFRVLTANLHYTQDQDKYRVTLDTKTSGILGFFVPWEGVFESFGILKNNIYTPHTHYSSAIWKKEVETTTYRYNKDGTFNGLFIEGTNHLKEQKQVDPALADHTTDILSATLNALNHDGCNSQADIFDGKRRYQTNFRALETQTLTASRFNVFGGEAVLCDVEIFPKGGHWHKKPRGWLSIQEHGRKEGMLPSFWYAPIQPETKTHSLNLPVKVIVHTKFGTLRMNLAKISN